MYILSHQLQAWLMDGEILLLHRLLVIEMGDVDVISIRSFSCTISFFQLINFTSWDGMKYIISKNRV